MTKKIRAVMFDLDGTLLDTAPDFIVVVNKLRAEYQQQPLAADVIRACVSNGSKALIRLAFDIDENHAEFERRRLRLLELYLDNLAVYTAPFPGIDNLLAQLDLHNIAWGIATNKPAIYTLPLMDALDMQPAPLSIICPDHVKHSKPDPEALVLASQQLGCSTDEIIFIGDHKRDIDCGKGAGSITIAAAYGYIDKDDDISHWEADYCVNHADEIWPIIKQYI